MMKLQQETTLAKVRLHWGIFIPVVLFAFFLVVATLPFIFLARSADRAWVKWRDAVESVAGDAAP